MLEDLNHLMNFSKACGKKKQPNPTIEDNALKQIVCVRFHPQLKGFPLVPVPTIFQQSPIAQLWHSLHWAHRADKVTTEAE